MEHFYLSRFPTSCSDFHVSELVTKIISKYLKYEAYSESKYRFAVKKIE